MPTTFTTPDEDAALRQAVADFAKPTEHPVDGADEMLPFERFRAAHPHSGWSTAVALNLGLAYYRGGYFTRAFEAFETAWNDGKHTTNGAAKPVVDRAVGELARMHSRVGHLSELDAILEEVANRSVTGPATELLASARDAAWTMRHDPGVSFMCGPRALENTLRELGTPEKKFAFLGKEKSGTHGYTLTEVSGLAKEAGLSHALVRRAAGAPVPVPSVVNWKTDHYAAIVGYDEATRLYHVKDPTFGGREFYLSQRAIDEESSGFFLVPKKPSDALPAGWQAASEAEAANVHGKGFVTVYVDNMVMPFLLTIKNAQGQVFGSKPEAPPGTQWCSIGMCRPDAHLNSNSLNLRDTPAGYAPQRGPSVFVSLTYNQRDGAQPGSPTFFNLGRKWTIDALSYITYDSSNPSGTVTRYVSGGGQVIYTGYSSGSFPKERFTGAVLSRTPATGVATSFTLTEVDGTTFTFSQTDGSTTTTRSLFLSAVTDPSGNSLSYAYDKSSGGGTRLIAIVDAAGRTTSLSYGEPTNDLLVTGIGDPFGRTASLTYSNGQLASITDVIGITSSFSYKSGTDFVQQLSTPYGNSTFSYAEGANAARSLELTDALGNTERIEFLHGAPGISNVVLDSDGDGSTSDEIPSGLGITDDYNQYRNTFYWDRNAYAKYGTGSTKDYTKATTIYHWLHTSNGGGIGTT
ncbi:MAG TPA: hypothetical protein VMI54_26280, partial [Polyangiaceae bacterium]|nr:hypothetical protein [Polyangiaceae bacterium]